MTTKKAILKKVNLPSFVYGTKTIFLDGKEIVVDDQTTTSDLKKRAGIGHNRKLAVLNKKKNIYKIYNENKPVRDNSRYMSLPDFTYGYNFLVDRLRQEAKIISKSFPVRIDPENPSYIMVYDYPLNSNFSQSKTTLLVKIPSQYPFVGPEHFYMKREIKYKGKCPSHYFKHDALNELSNLGWGKFCCHPQSWRPSHCVLEGDNLITYLYMIKAALDNIKS